MFRSYLPVLFLLVAGSLVAQDSREFQETLKETFKDQKSATIVREKLWPNGAPGAKGEGENDTPTLDLYLPAQEKATGAAVVVLPGGGYGGLAIGHEGKQVAEFLNSHGVAAFVLRYRLGSHGYRHPIMIGDAHRAIRFVRSQAEKFGVKPDRIGILGFSAGGHLASTAATHFDAGDAQASDPMDRVSCRPDFAVLCYPVIDLGGPYGHGGSKKNLLGDNPDPALVENLTNHKQVTRDTPPTFLFHTDQDTGVPPENSILFYMACREHKVPVELHIYRHGPHGVGLGQFDPILKTWPDLLINWMKGLGLIQG